jgi:hypothetical protein
LSNAKYWYLTFVYKFTNVCLDQNKFHFVYTDTDSYYFAVAGNPNRDFEQYLEEIVIDKEFYDKNYPLFFPEKKTLLSLEYERCCYDMIALSPKNYYTNDKIKPEIKLKGVTVKDNINKQINKDAFEKCINNGEIISAENYILRTKNQQISKQILKKTGISGVCTKSVVLENDACLPFIYNVPSSNYHFK